jgi:hypothetical protein
MFGMSVSDLHSFARSEFGGSDLGDARLDRRLVNLVEKLAADPGMSIPKAMGDWSQAKAAYRFFANDDVTRDKVLDSHYAATVERVADSGAVLVVQDSCYLNYTHHPATEGLGNIGSKGQKNQLRGVMLHSSLAVAPGTHRVMGLLDQQVVVREGYQAKDEKSKKMRKRGDRESEKWSRGAHNVAARLPQPASLIFVFDREGDVFEAIEQIQDLGARFVIRAEYNRLLEADGGERAYLLDSVRKEAAVARMSVTVPAGGGRAERIADVVLRAGSYAIRPPSDRKRRGCSRKVNLLWIVEEKPPKGVAALEWYLLTSEPLDTAEAAIAVARHYCGRWKIEEWHKALKTGCKMEERQLEDWGRLGVLLAILSVVAWRLLVLRDAARAEVDCPADALSEEDREILRRLQPSLARNAPAREYLRAVAKLGGFLARKSDGHPGWITLWLGYARLCDMRLGFRAAGGR